jgi:hypothetical protein
MRAARLLALATLLVSGCDVLEPGPADRLPGRYRMVTYGGRPLPAVVRGQAGMDRVELVSAEMELRRNFRWVQTSHADSIAGGTRHSVVQVDSGVFGFHDRGPDVGLMFTTRDGKLHHAATRADTLDVLWSADGRHDLFVR